ncbi:hypothetical protein [Marivirga harenae]|uniref:hypothetical protein n=1 Tax=Marivirga harenae TaxID=2010992 RepID=UPI0026DF8F89|nr:hypothetical protein [Marivirga harenae]WKV12679.1 hypothetical protein Q3Y49_02400 [Marivirga harenae]
MRKIINFIKDFFDDLFSYPEISNEEMNRYYKEREVDQEKMNEIRMKRIKLVIFLFVLFWIVFLVIKK